MLRKMLPARITYRWLKSKGACDSALQWFKTRYPNGVSRITAKGVREMVIDYFDFGYNYLSWLRDLAYDANSGGYISIALSTPKEIAAWLRARQRSPRKRS